MFATPSLSCIRHSILYTFTTTGRRNVFALQTTHFHSSRILEKKPKMPPKKKVEEVPVEKKGPARFARVKNTLKMGCVGLPNVGKSSTFNLLTGQSVAAENFPFCTIDPSVSRCKVPDERFEKLCKMYEPPSKIPAWLNITDIAGLVKGAAEGAGLGNAFLSHIQAVDGIFHVVRAFENDEIVHVDDSVDPVRDLETIQNELCLKDLVFYEQAMEAEQQAVKKNPKMKITPLFTETMAKVKDHLENNRGIAYQEWTEAEVFLIRDKLKTLITTKPIVYLVNLTKDSYIKKKSKWLMKIKTWIDERSSAPMIPYSVEFEEEIAAMEDDERTKYLAEIKCKSAIPKIISAGYNELALQTFLTAGDPEVRAWTVQKGSLAPQAAGVIHQDFERGFIKAEVVAWKDFDELQTTKGLDKVKAAGKWRQEGKNYVMQDGDIVHFQFNVTAKKK
eukprot:m.333509 g.333509  ORF g.333509 m.333509 type:complete len:447 (+) comp17161_c0_seq1:33-1373(+)